MAKDFLVSITVPDDAYDASSWNGNQQVPTKNAIRDKIESLSAGSASSFSAAEKNLSSSPRRAGKFTITGLSGLTIGKPVNIFQAVAPYTGKGTRADEAEMDAVIVSASVTAVDTITAYWNSATRVRGNFKFNYIIGA